jgi:adenine-specific DNA methylase
VLLGLLLPDPCDKECPPKFKSAARDLLAKRYGSITKSDEELREVLLKFIGEFANWDHAANALYLEIGRGLVKAAHPEETPVVVDPFAGGGSIPLEALRLGCEAFASDLNPVACLILKTLLEDIPRYGNADFKLADENGKPVVVHGLADALRHAGRQIKEAAEKELAQFYPADSDGSRPIAYLWARTVRCEAVGCGAEIPLMRSFWLSKKAGRNRALRYHVEKPRGKTPRIAFEIFEPKRESDVPARTVNRANATCICCNIVLPAARVRAQLVAQRGGADVAFDDRKKRRSGAMLLGVVALHPNKSGRQYRLPNDRDYAAIFAATEALRQKANQHTVDGVSLVPNEPTPIGGGSGAGRAFSYRTYGAATFRDVFNARQMLALTTFAERIRARQGEPRSIVLALGKLADLANAMCPWEPIAECPRNVLSNARIKPSWGFAEGVPISESSASFAVCLENLVAGIESVGGVSNAANTALAEAQRSPLASSSATIWFTDPPYYDAIPYSGLADFFFVWFKRALPSKELQRDPFDRDNQLTPKEAEIVQDEACCVNGKPKDRQFFEHEMGMAFAEARRVLRDDGVGCVVFAHKTTEGWEALLSGMTGAGWVINASWPITTEAGNRLRARDSAALAGSVHLVCRPRDQNAGVGDWSEVKAAMERRIRQWLPTLLKHGVRGADAIFSCLGPALESYSKFEKVLTAADREVPLGGDPDAIEPHERGFLAYVFETLSKEALRQVLGDAETEGFEEDARLTALFLWTLQASKSNGNGAVPVSVTEDAGESEDEGKPKKAKAGVTMPFDTFIRLTRPMGIHYELLQGSIIEIEKGVVRLLPVRERIEDLLGEAAERQIESISLQDFRQLELGLIEKRRAEVAAPLKRGKGKAIANRDLEEVVFTTLDRLHRAMLLFNLGRSTLLRQLLENEMREGKRFERLALALNALYSEGSDERRMLEGVQASMRGVR